MGSAPVHSSISTSRSVPTSRPMTSRRIPVRWPAAGLSAALAAGSCVAGTSRTPSPPAGLSDLWADVRARGLEDRTFDHAEYWSTVLPILERTSLLEVEDVGRSAEGRALRMVSFGSGSTPVLLWSQMHGDESTATMSLADLFAFLADHADHPVAAEIVGRLRVHVVPMLNPDGAQRFQRRNAQGIDINRDARYLATPEARTLKAVRDRVAPAFAFNLHDQGVGTRVGDGDRGVAIALLAPPFDRDRSVNPARRGAMEVAGVIRTAIEPLVGGHVARYDDTFNPRAFGDLMTVWGAGTILIESGGWSDDPEKQYLRRVNFVALVAALHAIATGSYEGVGTDLYLTLPENGRRVAGLLVRGGIVAVPGLPELRADLLINYEDGAARTGGRIADIGDLADAEAQDTVSIEGLYVVPADEALERDGGAQLQPGAIARFVVSRTPDGSDPVWRFDERMPPAALP